jgi:hypothetical protein
LKVIWSSIFGGGQGFDLINPDELRASQQVSFASLLDITVAQCGSRAAASSSIMQELAARRHGFGPQLNNRPITSL